MLYNVIYQESYFIANNNMRSVILEIKTTDVRSLKNEVLVF